MGIGFIFILVCVISALLAIAFAYLKWKFTYWRRKGLPYLEPSIPFGNVKETILQQCSFSDQSRAIYNKVKELGYKHAGIFFLASPVYIPVHPELIKNILQRDFDHFTDRGLFVNEETDPLSAHLFALDGAKWRSLRTKLSPTFTSGKMKVMFKILEQCTRELDPILQEHAMNKKPVDIKELMGRFTTDVISSCAFGLETSCLKDPDSEFRTYGKKIFATEVLDSLRNSLVGLLPHNITNKLGLKSIRQEVEDFFMDVVKNNLEYRRKNGVERSDFFQLLLQLQDSDPSFTFGALAAQAFVFFAAGFETSSTLMLFAFLELSLNQDIQDKLRNEIKTVLHHHNNEVTYDAIMEMHYLDQVINETLRKYPPVAVLIRQCNKDYRIPETDVVLEKGTQAIVSAIGIHMDPEYYPNPNVFDPERFSPENKSKRSTILHLPFGDGPRNCIGLRFGLMQSKVGILTLLRNYRFAVNEKTKIPVKTNPRSPIPTPLENVLLNIEET